MILHPFDLSLAKLCEELQTSLHTFILNLKNQNTKLRIVRLL
jgi:hypothetical protein